MSQPSGPLCKRCDHALSAHCKGNVLHSYYKEDLRPANDRKCNVTCHTRHCLNPICSCVDFIEG
jgi:hypothetical protein